MQLKLKSRKSKRENDYLMQKLAAWFEDPPPTAAAAA
jgi:hypothetical protein